MINDSFPVSQYCTKPYSKKNLTDEKALLNYSLFTKRIITDTESGVRIFTYRAALTPNKAAAILMATSVLCNLLGLELSYSYTPKCPIYKIQSNESLLQVEWRERLS